MAEPEETPLEDTWFSPGRLLMLFIAMNLLIYADRGVIACNGVNGAASLPDGSGGFGIQGDFGLTLFEDGILPAAFMVGLLASSPFFAEMSKHCNPFRLIAIGLGVWTLSTAGCGLATGFWSLLLCRMAVGIGEASFVALAAPFIDDHAPKNYKTQWLAMLYLCVPAGYALGYIGGGLVAGPFGWRSTFFLEAGMMLPFAIFCAFAPPLSLRKDPLLEDGEKGLEEEGLGATVKARTSSFFSDLTRTLKEPVFVCTMFGYAVYTAVIGAYGFWGPKAGRDVFKIPGRTADLTFGVVTVLAGIVGTLAGGFVLDQVGATLANALLICITACTVGCALIIVGFMIPQTLHAFILPFAMGEFALFSISAPCNAVGLWSVPTRLRPFAMSLNILVIHLLGDVPSPPILGLIQGRIQNWRISMSIASALLIPSACLYGLGLLFSRNATDYRQVQGTSKRNPAGAQAAAEAGVADSLLPGNEERHGDHA
ncbi:hypothetical protein WJX74_005143 [Apatococcus lobatus]|uniref:Major facilitator superfamily (MFS) profile domain-containing protein n=1 Tax=Apatococcus lobatus TaxID=904363 RepID=A0AAW1SEG4_9CHLO